LPPLKVERGPQGSPIGIEADVVTVTDVKVELVPFWKVNPAGQLPPGLPPAGVAAKLNGTPILTSGVPHPPAPPTTIVGSMPVALAALARKKAIVRRPIKQANFFISPPG
jgi:hypothetical protein